MIHLAIRQSGGANIVSLPKAVLKTLGLHVGSELDLSLQDNKIILTPVKNVMNLETLLKGSPKSKLFLSDEDKQWLNAPTEGKEI